MRYGQIRQYDTANGEGIRTTFFVTGCMHNCPHCFNAQYMNFCFGKIWTQRETDLVVEYLESPMVSGLTILGGEPFQNLPTLTEVVAEIRRRVPDKSIWSYSGYTWEEIMADEQRREMLQYLDVLIDGRFVNALKDLRLKFRGSSNQRIINVPASLKAGEVVLYLT